MAEPLSPAHHEHWQVEVSANAGPLVSIGWNWLSGESNLTDADEATIRLAAQHLLAFLGDAAKADAADQSEAVAWAVSGHLFGIKESAMAQAEAWKNSAGTPFPIKPLYPSPPSQLLRTVRDALDAGLIYRQELMACANDPNAMSSHCTAEGEDLDVLFDRWEALSDAALAAVDKALGGKA